MATTKSAILFAVMAAMSVSALARQPAFPTAEGFGKYAKGGRDGAVYIVNNLRDAGPGSLRECVEAQQPRTCVFSVSGEIRLDSKLHARHPYLTIAGQTAPGDGIQLSNRYGGNLDSPLHIDTHDVIVRHLRVRPGPPSQQTDNVDGVLVTGHSVILDHMSISWSNDEILNIVGNGGTIGDAIVRNAHDITVQWSFLYEPLRNALHSKGEHGYGPYISYGARDVTMHHNLIAHSQLRNPNFSAIGQIDFLGNVVYNWQEQVAAAYSRHGDFHLNWVGNTVIAGPDSVKKNNRNSIDLFRNSSLGEMAVFLGQNLDHNRPSFSAAGWRGVIEKDDRDRPAPAPVGYGALSYEFSTLNDPQQNYKDVLDFAGATRPSRDAADARIVAEVQTCSGSIIDDPYARGGWPELFSDPAPADNDRDGMADAWETARGLDPAIAADRNGDDDGDGYTNLEEYLNELAGDDLGVPIGRGRGADAVTTCGYAIASGPDIGIRTFALNTPVVRPGKKVRIELDSNATTCKKSWDLERPYLTEGVWAIYPFEDVSLSVSCVRDGVYEMRNHYVFVNRAGKIPRPSIHLDLSAHYISAGDPVEVEWMAGTPGDPEAGICVASGIWSGFRSVLGRETIYPTRSGPVGITCHGPGGTFTTHVDLTVN
jgi:pectate lyase